MKQTRKRLTYANVMSSIAVFLVLGGATAFAATQLGKNSVGTKQLKKNSVTTAKIKKNAVTGVKVKESTLGTVPSATLANSIPAAEATRLVGSSGQPGFEGGSFNAGSIEGINLGPVGFYKDHEGIVHLEGVAKAGPEVGTTNLAPIFALPAGFRPAPNVVLLFSPFESIALVGGSGASLAGIFSLDGKVAGEANEIVPLDGITFRAVG